MKTYTYTETRANLKEVLDRVTADREEAIVSRPGKEDVVLIAAHELESLRETAYLLRSPANAQRLLDSIARLERGEGVVRELIDE